MTKSISIKLADLDDLDELVPLFDAYRMFYEQASNLNDARQFLLARMKNNESTILIARVENKAVGFVQLYPIFSSVSMRKAHLLNDLFVDSSARNMGVGEKLLSAAREWGIRHDSKYLLLETYSTNIAAQKLYQKTGWKKLTNYFYELDLD